MAEPIDPVLIWPSERPRRSFLTYSDTSCGDFGVDPRGSRGSRSNAMIKIAIITAVLLLATPAGAQSIAVRKIGQCPAGYASGAHWCTPMPGNKRDAIPKGQRGCPSGWIVSGAYCLSPERRR